MVIPGQAVRFVSVFEFSGGRVVSIPLSQLFFFQADDGIRDIGVTGVQTCALPIWRGRLPIALRAGDAARSDATRPRPARAASPARSAMGSRPRRPPAQGAP